MGGRIGAGPGRSRRTWSCPTMRSAIKTAAPARPVRVNDPDHLNRSLSSRFISQRFYRTHRCRSLRRVQGGGHRNYPQQPASQQPGPPCCHQASKEIWHGEQVHEEADSVCNSHAYGTTQERNQQGFDEELLEDGAGWSSQRLAHTDLTSSLPHGDHHDVHYAQAAQEEGHDADRAQKVLHAICHLAESLGFLHRVPDGTGFLVTRIEVVHA